ncbi:hypothetical protein EB796_012105 [Bugula neritina]|uniref:Ion transport domain-containing protein n=1 Tax=Bugula neritina TaxID=10212 RepID=A0A7J7JW08_BUGNE|nr:hypothetical protein EB796_012105 [Bugula neritina]
MAASVISTCYPFFIALLLHVGGMIRLSTRRRTLHTLLDANNINFLDANDSNSSSVRNGQGLDDIHEHQYKGASNRALLQYFAKLGQSSRSDEVLDLDFVEGLLKQGANINCTDIYGQTIFHEVARTWHIDVGKFLLEHDADINKADNYGRTPLHVAAAVDYADMCEFLISKGADKEARTKGELQTPLFYAARNDATMALAALIKCECEYKHISDYKGRTPIYVAAELDRSETARYLLEHNAPVGVTDNSGQPALTWMINKMAPVAKEALDQLHTCDRANRKQYFYLNHLEPIQPVTNQLSANILSVHFYPSVTNQLSANIVSVCFYLLVTNQLGANIVSVYFYPSVTNQLILISIRWLFSTSENSNQNSTESHIGGNFSVLYTAVLTLHSAWYYKCLYRIPQDIWKIVIYVLAVGFTIYQIIDELNEFISSQREHQRWKEWRIKQIEEDINFCHPRWPEEKIFLENEKEDLDKFKSNYFQDFWSLHCNAWRDDRRFPEICLSLSHLPYTFLRCFLDGVWGTVNLQALPANDTCAAANLVNPTYTQTIKGMHVPDEMIFTMYRLTLVDEYDLDAMLDKDKPMTYVLLGMWFWISAILCINLFIALLSDTFQREHIKDECSPEIVYYDDDTGEGGDELKKVTIQTKEKVAELMDMWTIKFGMPAVDEAGQKYYPFDNEHRHSHDDVDNEMGGDGGHDSYESAKTSVPDSVTESKLENEIDILRAELTQVEKKRREFERKCLSELSSLKSLLTSAAAHPVGGQTQPLPVRLASLPDYHGNLRIDTTAISPPTYPAAIAERITPRDDQMSLGTASTSHVDIATMPHSGAPPARPVSLSPAVRVNVAPEHRIAFSDSGDAPDV